MWGIHSSTSSVLMNQPHSEGAFREGHQKQRPPKIPETPLNPERGARSRALSCPTLCYRLRVQRVRPLPKNTPCPKNTQGELKLTVHTHPRQRPQPAHPSHRQTPGPLGPPGPPGPGSQPIALSKELLSALRSAQDFLWSLFCRDPFIPVHQFAARAFAHATAQWVE